MMKYTSLPAAEIDRLVEEAGTPVAAPLAMPQQILEPAGRQGLFRAFLAVFTPRPASHQEL